MKPDLHMHSTCSDGILTPKALYQACEAAHLTHMALTDHDTYAGLDEIETCQGACQWIPGVEISLKPLRSFHLLVYGDGRGTEMAEKLEELRKARVLRAYEMLEKLTALGISLSDEGILCHRAERESVGRMHIARSLIQAGYVQSIQEAFERYLGEGKPAYVEQARMTMEEALALATRCHLFPVLAHPREMGLQDHQLEPLLRKWKDQGLQGMEVYHPSAKRLGFDGLLAIARRYDLVVTGGSDYHDGEDLNHAALGGMTVFWRDLEKDMQVFLEKIQQVSV